VNNHKVIPPRLYHPRPKAVKPYSSGGSTSYSTKQGVRGVVGLTRRKIDPIHHMPQPPTLIPTDHVLIVMHMGMMLIIASHFTRNYGWVNHRTLVPIWAKVLGRVRREKCGQQKVGHQASSRLAQHHGH